MIKDLDQWDLDQWDLDQWELIEEMVCLDVAIGERYLGNDSSYLENDSLYPEVDALFQSDITMIVDMLLQSDIAYSLFLAENIDERKSEIEDILRGSSKYAEIKEIVSVDDAYKEATIRKDFVAALKAVKKGYDLSSDLRYSLSDDDLMQLAKLHKANRFRKKIEELLEDCTCHEECDLMSSGDYSKWL